MSKHFWNSFRNEFSRSPLDHSVTYVISSFEALLSYELKIDSWLISKRLHCVYVFLRQL